MVKLSVLIPSFNSEKTVRPTLESVKWADEILICDSFSTDRTLDIARDYGARIIQHEYINSASQKNWAIPQCRNEWVLIVDTDEVLEPGMKEEIQRLLSDNGNTEGFWIPRKNFIYGKWMRCGGIYPDLQLRLFRRDKGRYEAREVHAHLTVPGKQAVLTHHFLHEGFKDLGTWLVKSERYVRYEIDELENRQKRFGWTHVTFFPLVVFLKTYFLKAAILEGYRGFLLAILDSFYYFLIYARLYERQILKNEKD
jgi:glycosyltransferase involved in cell wall biosynthesis